MSKKNELWIPQIAGIKIEKGKPIFRVRNSDAYEKYITTNLRLVEIAPLHIGLHMEKEFSVGKCCTSIPSDARVVGIVDCLPDFGAIFALIQSEHFEKLEEGDSILVQAQEYYPLSPRVPSFKIRAYLTIEKFFRRIGLLPKGRF